jgi:heme/copper-type cytochrome/quinol oxidase subunit 2
VGSRARLVLLAATVLAAVVLFLVLRPGDEQPTQSATPTSETSTSTDSETGATTTAETSGAVGVQIEARGDGSASIRRVTIERGQRVTLIVSSDVADEVHVHGYDLMADVAPGSPARISFEASVPGRFDVELESRAIQIAELRVNP